MTAQEYLAVLFNPGESVWACSYERLRRKAFAMTQETALSCAAGRTFPNGAFLSINPAIPGTTRCTSNVLMRRNFLIESDVGAIEEQIRRLHM